MSKMKEKSVLQNRITELDLFRGIAVLLMIFDHFMFDMWGLFPSVFIDYPPFEGGWSRMYTLAYRYWFWDVREAVRTVIVFVFLALTGICCSFSRSNLKRGAKLGGVAVVMSAVTFAIGYVIGDIDIGIAFGVLHCIALVLLIIGALEKLNTNRYVYLILGIAAVVAGVILEHDQPYVSYNSMPFFELLFKTVLGTVSSGGDSFSLFFNGGQIMIGVFLGEQLYSERKPLLFKKYSSNPLTFIGRHSLAVYVIHQIAIPLAVGAVMLLCGFTLAI